MKSSYKILILVLILLISFVAFIYISVNETQDNFRTCRVHDIDDFESLDFRRFDSVMVSANTLYEASIIKKAMQGEQYREAWKTPIRVPIVYLDTLKGGVRVIDEGGGKQTHSLELEDKKGIRYALRSLSKDPKKLVPEIAKTLGLENIIVDGISAQHPYAAIPVAMLSDKANILHTKPRLVFVPKQELLGTYNKKYGNRLYYFEYESENKVNWTDLDNVEEIVDTEGLLALKIKLGDKLELDREALIRARLFDLLIGDWDRHAKQWGWVIVSTNDIKKAIPLPTDRDNAFFMQEGILPTLITNDLALPEVQAFKDSINYMPGLIRPFDEYFLRDVPLRSFIDQSLYLQKALTDQVINESFGYWPDTIYELDGEEIKNKILSRRDAMPQYAKEFHRIMSERPLNDVDLKGCKDIELPDFMKQCFDCEKP